MDDFPKAIRELMTDPKHPLHKTYRKYAREINNRLSFASFECKTYDIEKKNNKMMIV